MYSQKSCDTYVLWGINKTYRTLDHRQVEY